MGLLFTCVCEGLESRTLMSAPPSALWEDLHGGRAAVVAPHGRRRPVAPVDVVGTYSGTVVRSGVSTNLTIEIASKEADGDFTGRLTFTTEGGETFTSITGTVHARVVRFGGSFGNAGVFGRGRISRDGHDIRGTLAQQVIQQGKRHPGLVRSRMTLAHQLQSTALLNVLQPGASTPAACGCSTSDAAES